MTTLNIVSWNCNMAFRRKQDAILACKPDLLLLQECSRADAFALGAPFCHWVGSNPHKGMAAIAISNLICDVDRSYCEDLPWFIPLNLAALDLRVLAVWAHVKSSRLRYVRLSHAALQRYRSWWGGSMLAMGDFNSNAIWDRQHGAESHSKLVDRFSGLGMESAFHTLTGESQGEETISTQFMYRHLSRGYHLDYAFASTHLLELARFEVGRPEDWLAYSDHMPLFLAIDVPEHAGL